MADSIKQRIIRKIVRIYRKLPFEPLKEPMRRIWARHRSKNKDKIVIAEIEGITYELDLSELIDHVIYYEGCFEADTTAIISKLTKKGMTAFDIGANIGCHTFRLAKLVGPNGRVFAFEPMPWAFRKLTRNCELNNFKNLRLERFAVSDRSIRNQEVHFRSSWKLESEASDHVKPDGAIERSTVDFIKLDDYISNNKVDKLDIIKMDVDGYEYKVLQGAIASLKKYQPIIIMELGAVTLESVGDKVTDLIEMLQKIGYRFYNEKTMKEYPSNEILLKAIPKDATVNIVISTKPLK